ncbi:MAG: peptidoglycan DD-metalloendopeptidase family protein [Gemmatimonadetes bacterium]|nr:peptidoglycan DD-metalloendopeptidase family protein [Gemmatimonadota bacterium]
MPFRKIYNVIIVPADHSGTRQYRVSLGLVLTAVVLLVALLGAMVVFMLTYGGLLRQARQASQLEAENAELKEQVLQVNQLNDELENLSSLRAQLVALLGSQVDLPQESDEDWGEVELPIESLELDRLDHLRAADMIRSYSPTLWPTPGRVRREFTLGLDEGAQRHPGLSIEAPAEAPVRASGRGRVLAIDHDATHGNHVILDHGLGVRSLYAGAERIVVAQGQMVDQSQILAYLGSSNGETSALYFEVRVDGEPIDPRRYLPRNR